ncbi:hypothetical protein [Bradyrhizobium sp. RD5-C2]|nr:hypothetical protein [Bradyrhizobium sp. RD5-C2]
MDEKITHYKTLAARLTDQQTLDGIARLIAEHQAEKQALHPEPKE